MRIIIHDTLAQLEPLFTGDMRPQDKLDQAQQGFMNPDGGLGVWLQKHITDSRVTDILQTARVGGFGAADTQQGWGMFSPTCKRELSEWEYQRYAETDYLAQLETHLQAITAQLRPESPDALHVYPLPCDFSLRSFMVNSSGRSVCAFEAGQLLVRVFPSEANLSQLEPHLSWGVLQAVRLASQPSLATLADWLAWQGAAARFVGDWRVPFTPSSDWEATLQWVAEQYNLSDYANMPTNTYGQVAPMGTARPPTASELGAEELDYTRAVLRDMLDETNANTIAAALYGDAVVASQGAPGVGLSPYAGIAAAAHAIPEDTSPNQLMTADTRTLLAFRQ